MDGPVFRLPPVEVKETYVALSEQIDWSQSNTGMPDVWKETQGDGVIVLHLDTGVQFDHPDLADAILDARDFTGSQYGPSDVNGHGTHTAGTIAARANGTGVIGGAPKCKLVSCKVLGDNGTGSDRNIAEAIEWAMGKYHPHAMNLSLGSPQISDYLLKVVLEAAEAGVLIVCAAGNDGRPNSVNEPARRPQTLAVAAYGKDGRPARFTSRGPQVDICAPGVDITSTYPGSGYAKLSGTSMAAPFVTAVVACMKAKAMAGTLKLRNIDDLIEHIERACIDGGVPRKDNQSVGWYLTKPKNLIDDGQPAEKPGCLCLEDASMLQLAGMLSRKIFGALPAAPKQAA